MHAKRNRDTVPQVTNGRINGRFAPGYSGNAGGSPDAVRRVVNKAFLQDMAIAWRKHGAKALDRVAKEHPAAFCKMYTLIIPRQLTLEHSNAIKNLSDEALEAMIQHLEASLEAKAQGSKVIEGTTFAALSAPRGAAIGAGLEPKRQRRPNRLIMQAGTRSARASAYRAGSHRPRAHEPASGRSRFDHHQRKQQEKARCRIGVSTA
jgi:hypothetical protein